MRKKYEYKTVIIKPRMTFWEQKYDPQDTDKVLNEYGSEGWELVCVESREYLGQHLFHYTFKREL